MNRYQFEEVLFDALYAPMRAAWNKMDVESEVDVVEIEDIEVDDYALDAIALSSDI